MNSSRRSWYGIFIAVLSFLMVGGALLTALAGDEIRVAQGIYVPTQDPFDREATFDLKDGVSIIGGHAGLSHDPHHAGAYE